MWDGEDVDCPPPPHLHSPKQLIWSRVRGCGLVAMWGVPHIGWGGGHLT